MRHPGHAAWGLGFALLAGSAAAQVAVPAGIEFDGGRFGGFRAGEAAAPPAVGAAREVSSGLSFEIIFGDPWEQDGHRRGQGYGSWRWERVKQLAHEVEEAARHLRRAADGRGHHGDWSEDRFRRAAYEFERSAEHFHRQVESWRQDPSHSRSDFYRLSSAFRELDWAIRQAHADGHVWSDFQRARVAIEELDLAYRGGYYDDRGHDDHGRDRDRDHDRGRRYPPRPRYPRH